MFGEQLTWSGSVVALMERFRLDGATLPPTHEAFRAVLLSVQTELSRRGIQIRLDGERVEIWEREQRDDELRGLQTRMLSVSAGG